MIDVRSPSEFTEDRIPGAINLPVLNDQERAKIGTIYHQVSPFAARKLGAAIVSQNISKHLVRHFASKDKGYSPLVYCWRGGQRSSSLAFVLSQIGWQVTLLEGGYKTYRAYVREQLEILSDIFTYKILCGLTGTGKTYILQRMKQRGAQVLDLEELANHRGSLLGQAWDTQPEKQPTQKYFESLLLQQLQQFDSSQPVWIESESNKIGQIHIPPRLWEKMKQSSCVEVQLPLASRINWLLQEYSHLVTNPELLKTKLKQLKSRYGRQKIEYWFSLIDRQCWQELIKDLLENHYDPAYQRSLHQFHYQRVEKQLIIQDLSASRVEALLDQLSCLSQ